MFLQEYIVMTETSTHFCHDIQVYENTKVIATNHVSPGWVATLRVLFDLFVNP
jgi:hypothetical protein